MSPIDVSAIDAQLGAAIRSARMHARLKQAELAAAIGIDRTTLSNYERGSRGTPVGVLVQIAYELRVPLSELVPHARTMELAWAATDSQIPPDIQKITQTLVKRPDLASQVAEFLTLLTERGDLEAKTELLSD